MRNIYFNEENITLDEGLLFGRGAFETILVKEEPILFSQHIKRLNKAIEVLKIGEKIEEKELLNKIKEYEIKYKAVKILVTQRNIIILEREINYKDEDYKKGFKLKLSKVIRNSTSSLTYIKSINYIENLMENQKAKEEGYNEVIFLNEKGFVTEGSTSNIFIIKKGIIYTPKVECGLLNGILRSFIINNFTVIEKKITLKELLESDEIFITNSLVGIMKVTSIKENSYIENNITKKIISKYKEYIG
ncbi:aminotransferase class IV [Clostridium gasigenes]|uniref:Aminotransferase class IV n=1 Tax=Clostridium gasigenes TaxID=94869 RepID=A0A7X0SCL3_9CLOT|nr:aminotransferase class IV [Clostridium gasigenes]MBB6713767.1 aminotransferase class IV [Clostridium gasigenes]